MLTVFMAAYEWRRAHHILHSPFFFSVTRTVRRSNRTEFPKLGVEILNSDETPPLELDVGAVKILVEALHNELIIWRNGSQTRYRAYLEPSDALFIALICSSLDRHLQCPNDSKLEEVLLVVNDEMIPSLKAVIRLFVPWFTCDTTVRNITLSKSARIISRITNHIHCGHHELFDALVPVLQCHMAPDIRVDAACAVATLFYYLEKRAMVPGEVESLMISTLTTAAISVSDDRLEEVVWALTYLVAFVPNTRAKIAKRRCSILAINKLMAHSNPSIRRHALDLSLCIITNAENAVNRMGCQNMDLFLDELSQRSVVEQDADLQALIVKNIEPFIKHGCLRSVYFERGMEALKSIAFSDVTDEASATQASSIYIKASRAPESSMSILKSVLDFTTLPIAEVRNEALHALSIAMKNRNIAMALLADQAAFENLVMLIRYGCDQDCAHATALIAELAKDEVYHSSLCSNMLLLEAIINLVKAKTNRSAHAHALDVILSLLSNHAMINSFLPFPDLLPHLITLVNSTTAEDDFKGGLVTAIMTMSKAILA